MVFPGCSRVSNLHSGSRTGREGDTYETAANSDVENDIQRAVGKAVPDILVVDSGTSDLEVLGTVEEEGDGLGLPAAGRTVDLNTPSVEVGVGAVDASAASDTITLVADTAGVDITVDGSVTRGLVIDHLHDIDLTTSRPAATGTDGVTQHPESRPHALLVSRSVGTEANGSLDSGHLASTRGEGVGRLETTRGPAAAVVPGDNLESVSTTELDILGAGGVGLLLAVDVQVTGDDVPVAGVGRSTAIAGEGVGPNKVVTGV